MLHQVFIEGVGDLQPTDERIDNRIIITVIHHDHFVLNITNVMFEALSFLHLDHEEVIDVLLKILSISVLVIESLLYLFETLK